jgi:hypothetical protein
MLQHHITSYVTTTTIVELYVGCGGMKRYALDHVVKPSR